MTVVGIDEGEIFRNGAALHIDQGIAVPSQAKTVDQVIVSVPVRAFSQANEALPWQLAGKANRNMR